MKTRNPIFALVLASAFSMAPHSRSIAQTTGLTAETPIAASAPTAVPSLVTYSGVATAIDGKALTGEAGITLQIYKDEVGGEALWSETQSVAIDPTGHYKVQLGAANPNGLPSDLFSSGEARWLEVQIAGQSPQLRILIASVPYALKASDATTLGGLPASAYALASKATPAISAAGTPATVTDVTTTGGTAGYLPEFNGAATIVDSPVFVSGSDIGIGTATPTATLDVDGTAIIRGALSTASSATFGGAVTIEAAGKATTAAGESSHSLALQASSYNSGSSEAVAQTFEWKAVPVGNDTATASASLEVLFGQGTATPAATGLAIGANGQITFATGQTFPGTGKGTITGVTAGTALTGGGTTGAVTVNLDTTKVPLLGAANTFTGNQTVTGSVTATSFSGNGAALTGVTAANSSELGGLAPAAYAALASGNTFSATQSFSKVGIGTTTPRSLLEGQATAKAALGPVFTLTNTAGGLGAESALDFNTLLPSTTGTYNPMIRIAAQDADYDSDNLLFQSNVPGAPNFGLQTNMIIDNDGPVEIGTALPAYNDSYGDYFPHDAQLIVVSSEYAGLQVTGGTQENISSSGNAGIVVLGGPDGNQGEVGGESGGDGADITGGTSSYTPGDGIYSVGGACVDSGGIECTTSGDAAYLDGAVEVTGTLTATVKDFKIDDPADPANKYLYHASVESSEMMNIYTGNVVTDELGVATVKLPSWFEAENTDFRYQLTVIGGRFAQAIVSKEIADHQFTISTNASNVKVSWQVTAVRQDPYAKAHPLVVEQEKPARERGFYQNPEVYGQPAEKQTEWGRRPQLMQHLKEMRAAQQKRAAVKPANSQKSTLSPSANAVGRNFVAESKSELNPVAGARP